jgi:hypothetical protein
VKATISGLLRKVGSPEHSFISMFYHRLRSQLGAMFKRLIFASVGRDWGVIGSMPIG